MRDVIKVPYDINVYKIMKLLSKMIESLHIVG